MSPAELFAGQYRLCATFYRELAERKKEDPAARRRLLALADEAERRAAQLDVATSPHRPVQ